MNLQRSGVRVKLRPFYLSVRLGTEVPMYGIILKLPVLNTFLFPSVSLRMCSMPMRKRVGNYTKIYLSEGKFQFPLAFVHVSLLSLTIVHCGTRRVATSLINSFAVFSRGCENQNKQSFIFSLFVFICGNVCQLCYDFSVLYFCIM